MDTKQKLFNYIKVFVLVVVLSIGATYMFAWTPAPTWDGEGNPPCPTEGDDMNPACFPPINVSDAWQIKSGNLTIGTTTPPTTSPPIAPNGKIGNVDANDFYIRTSGKWASQLGSGTGGGDVRVVSGTLQSVKDVALYVEKVKNNCCLNNNDQYGNCGEGNYMSPEERSPESYVPSYTGTNYQMCHPCLTLDGYPGSDTKNGYCVWSSASKRLNYANIMCGNDEVAISSSYYDIKTNSKMSAQYPIVSASSGNLGTPVPDNSNESPKGYTCVDMGKKGGRCFVTCMK